MFKASTWIERNALKRLMLVLKDYDEELSKSLEDYLDINNSGEYLMNILSSEEIRRLQDLENDWDLNSAMKNVRVK